jgi:uncharacterized peroxidase-related enzyme
VVTVALLDFPDLEDLDEGTRGALMGSAGGDGPVPAFPRMLANNPAVLEAALGQFGELVYGGDVDLDLKQLAFVVVSQENECAYCAATHGAELVNALGLPAPHLDAIAERDYSGFSDRQRAVAELARQAATDPKRVSADHIEALHEVGFDEADIMELVAVVAQASFANTVVDVLDVRPSDEGEDVGQYYPKPMPEHA